MTMISKSLKEIIALLYHLFDYVKQPVEEKLINAVFL